MWIIPAKVEGVWNLGAGILTIHQEFQMLFGTLKTDDKTSIITGGRLNGNLISFNVDGTAYSGIVTGKTTMSGTMISGPATNKWIGIREDH
jgi:hypothetical protein